MSDLSGVGDIPPVSLAVWLALSVGISELSALVDILTFVCSSLAGSACRNLCLSYLVSGFPYLCL